MNIAISNLFTCRKRKKLRLLRGRYPKTEINDARTNNRRGKQLKRKTNLFENGIGDELRAAIFVYEDVDTPILQPRNVVFVVFGVADRRTGSRETKQNQRNENYAN